MRTKNILNESLKTISSFLNVDIKTAKTIKQLISRDIEPDSFESVQKWIAQCYHNPTIEEMIQEALNEVLEFHGTESIENKNNWIDSFYRNINFIYLNSGDTYAGTIFFDTENEKYFLSDYGSVVENSIL